MFSTMYSNFTICGFYKNSNIINLNKSKNLESSVNFSIFIIPVKRKAYFWVRSESEENKNTCLCIQINEFSIQSMPESLKKHSQTAFFRMKLPCSTKMENFPRVLLIQIRDRIFSIILSEFLIYKPIVICGFFIQHQFPSILKYFFSSKKSFCLCRNLTPHCHLR